MATDNADRRYQRIIEEERLVLAASEQIGSLMDAVGVSRAELARRLGKSRGFVTQVLGGERNMTLRTLADLAFALDHRMSLSVSPCTAAAAPIRKNETKLGRAAATFRSQMTWQRALPHGLESSAAERSSRRLLAHDAGREERSSTGEPPLAA